MRFLVLFAFLLCFIAESLYALPPGRPRMTEKDETEILKLYIKGVLAKSVQIESKALCQPVMYFIAAKLNYEYTATKIKNKLHQLRRYYLRLEKGTSIYFTENQKKLLALMVQIDSYQLPLSLDQKASIQRVLDEVEADENISNRPQSSGQLLEHEVTEILMRYLRGAVTLNERRKNSNNLNLCDIVEIDSKKKYTASQCMTVIENLRQNLADSANGKTRIGDLTKSLMVQALKIDMNNHVQNPEIDHEINTLLRHTIDPLKTIMSSLQNN